MVDNYHENAPPHRVVGADPAPDAPYATPEAIRLDYSSAHVETIRAEQWQIGRIKYAGEWQIGGAVGLRVVTMKKPRLLTRVLCKALLEWEWVDHVN
jgi:hypothetical protein